MAESNESFSENEGKSVLTPFRFNSRFPTAIFRKKLQTKPIDDVRIPDVYILQAKEYPMKTISAKISDNDYRVLENLIQNTLGSKSEVVRNVVHEFCTKQAVDMKERNAIIDRAFGVFKTAPLDAKAHRENLSETIL